MSQFNAPTYDIERSTGTCAVTGRKLEPGEKYIATLVELDDSEQPQPASGEGGDKPTPNGATALGFKRLDFCQQAWDRGPRPPQLFGFWLSTVPQANQKKRLFVDDAVLMNLLTRLGETDQPQKLAFRFVLALILMRKRLLRYDRTERRPSAIDPSVTQEWWHVTPKLDLSKGPLGKWNDDERMQVLNPNLDEQQIQQVTEQLGQILEAEL